VNRWQCSLVDAVDEPSFPTWPGGACPAAMGRPIIGGASPALPLRGAVA
jgi:hypothetical protein